MRITPACAGKRYRCSCTGSTSQDHPRVCGEKLFLAHLALLKLGSPPRVRGKDMKHTAAIYRSGITPACAGKSSFYQEKI